MTTSNVERLKKIHGTLTSDRDFAYDDFESDYTIAASTYISVLLNSLPALLEIARHATDLVNSCDHCGGTKDDQWPCVKCSELKAALAKFNSLKIEGL